MQKIISLTLVALLIVSLRYGALISPHLVDGINLCINVIVPAFLLPLFIVEILVNFGYYRFIVNIIDKIISPIIKLTSGGTFVFLTGFLCGYPVGVKTATSLYNQNIIDKNEYSKIIKCCNNPSPAFLTTLIYPVVHQYNFSLIKLFMCTYGSSLICYFLFFNNQKDTQKRVSINNLQTSKRDLFEISKSVGNSLYIICSNVILFSSCVFLFDIVPVNSFVKGIFTLCLEITNGLVVINIENKFEIILLLTILMFGGLSITFQSLSIIKSKALFIQYLLGRLYVCSLTFLLTLALI